MRLIYLYGVKKQIPCGLLLYYLLVGFHAPAQTVSIDSVSLVDVMDTLSKRHGVKFAYDHAALLRKRTVMPHDSLRVEEALKVILHEHDYHYEWQDSVVLIIPHPIEVIKGVTLTGVVVDTQTGEPLPHATVSIPASSIYTLTNQEGKFSFVHVPYDTSTVEIRYMGYAVKKFTPKAYANQEKIDVEMSVASEVLEDVMISESKYKMMSINPQPSHMSLDVKEFSAITNFGEPDVFRSVQLLPGVSATNETSSGLSIRGGDPEQNLILFDGFTVYHLDHFFGVYSAFNSNVIKDVQLYKSAYGARWGTRISGVVDITGKSGNLHKFSGNLGINLLGANATLEIPLAKKTSLLIGVRRAYTDIIQSDLYKKLFNHLSDNQLHGGLTPTSNQLDQPVRSDFYFYDFNTKITHQFDHSNTLQISYYQGKDNLSQRNGFFYEIKETDFNLSEQIDTKELTDWGNRGGSLVYARQWGKRLYTKAMFSGSSFFRNKNYEEQYTVKYDSLGAMNNDSFAYNYLNRNLISEYKASIDAKYKINDRHIFDVGWFSILNKVSYQSSYGSENIYLDIDEKAKLNGAYAQYSYIPNAKLTIQAGFRMTDYSPLNDSYFEPRISISYKVHPQVTCKAAAGKYHQFIVHVDSEDPTINNTGFWLVGGISEVPLMQSNHYVLGATFAHKWYTLDIEGYHKNSNGLTNYILAQSTSEAGNEFFDFFLTGSGQIYGIDLTLKKNIGIYTGWLAYTLSKNKNRFEYVNNNKLYPSSQDERHELKSINLLKLKQWELSATWIYGSGKPYQLSASQFENLNTDNPESINIQRPNPQRLPAYHKLDIGISYLFSFPKSQLRTGLNFLNVYDRKNIKSIKRYSFQATSDRNIPAQSVALLGFTPSVFINFSF